LNKKPSWLYLDRDKLDFPLFVRQWKEGDYFYPYGMVKASGKIGKKKVGKFLRDEKVDALTRKNTYVLLSGQHIVAVLGMRIDARFVVDENCKAVFVIHKK
jgi:tRNA(Ile)-lysidine synthase